jgi:hypothetical protein
LNRTDLTIYIALQQAIQQGNSEGARIYGQDAIREKNQALNHLRMASRLDACCSRIETAVRMNQVTDGMKGVVKGCVFARQQFALVFIELQKSQIFMVLVVLQPCRHPRFLDEKGWARV